MRHTESSAEKSISPQNRIKDNVEKLRNYIHGEEEIFPLEQVTNDTEQALDELRSPGNFPFQQAHEFSKLRTKAWSKRLNREFENLDNWKPGLSPITGFENLRLALAYARHNGVDVDMKRIGEIRKKLRGSYLQIAENESLYLKNLVKDLYEALEEHIDNDFNPDAKEQAYTFNLATKEVDREWVLNELFRLLKLDTCWKNVNIVPTDQKNEYSVMLTYK